MNLKISYKTLTEILNLAHNIIHPNPVYVSSKEKRMEQKERLSKFHANQIINTVRSKVENFSEIAVLMVHKDDHERHLKEIEALLETAETVERVVSLRKTLVTVKGSLRMINKELEKYNL